MKSFVNQYIGRYKIDEQIAEDGFSMIYKSFDSRLERYVTVKIFKTERLAPEFLNKSLKRIEQQAKLLATLNHPNIVNVLDYGENNDIPYLSKSSNVF